MLNSFKKLNCIGIYGGTFNPIHNGHLMVINEALDQCDDMEKLILMPNNMPAYKESTDIVSSQDRLAMLTLIAESNKRLDISDMEIKRGGITYTYDTLQEILSQNPKLKIYFIIGSDSLVSIKKWYKYEELLKMCSLLVARREEDLREMQVFADSLKAELAYADIHFLNVKPYEAASSDIRKRISEGNFPDDILPKVIVEYIKEKKLYGCD